MKRAKGLVLRCLRHLVIQQDNKTKKGKKKRRRNDENDGRCYSRPVTLSVVPKWRCQCCVSEGGVRRVFLIFEEKIRKQPDASFEEKAWGNSKIANW